MSNIDTGSFKCTFERRYTPAHADISIVTVCGKEQQQHAIKEIIGNPVFCQGVMHTSSILIFELDKFLESHKIITRTCTPLWWSSCNTDARPLLSQKGVGHYPFGSYSLYSDTFAEQFQKYQ